MSSPTCAAFHAAIASRVAAGRGRAGSSPSASRPHAPETGYGYIRVGEAIAPRRPPRRALRREARPRDAPSAIWTRAATLERRHLPVPRRQLSRRAGGTCARHPRRRARRDGQGAARWRAACIPTPARSPPVAVGIDRLCGDGEGGARRGRAGRDGLVATSAAGTRCTRSPSRMTTATRTMARYSRSTPPIAWSAAKARSSP